MTQFTFQATSIRSLVKCALPSAESKNISDSNWSTLGVVKRQMTFDDGSTQQQHVLMIETEQPSFYLAAWMPLSTDEVEHSDTCVDITTRDLDTAIAAFRQRSVQVGLTDSSVELQALDNDDNGQSSRKHITVDGCEASKTQQLPQMGNITCVLADTMQLLDALRSTVGIASTRGNLPSNQGVRLTLHPGHLKVESCNTGVTASMHYDDPWTVAPAEHLECVVSTDAATHLITALAAFAICAPTSLCLNDGTLTVLSEGVYMEIETA